MRAPIPALRNAAAAAFLAAPLLAAPMLATPMLAAPLLAAGLLASPPAAAAVDVEFVDPAHFRDIDNHGFGTLRPAAVMDIVNRHLVTLGQQCLAADQTLEIRVTDMRLAGQLGADRGWFRAPDARLMRDVDWPSMDVSWQLKDAQGAVVQARTEVVSDMDYLHRYLRVNDDASSLPHERAMLTRWFHRRFCASK